LTATPRILAIGGGGFSTSNQDLPLDLFAAGLTGRDSPRICLLPTASGDPDSQIERFYSTFREVGGQLSHLSLFRLGSWPVALGRHLLEQDLIYVGGGSLVNLLALWQAHGLDEVMREAWRSGVVLCGVSAGAMCWFQTGISRSHGGPRAVPGLGLLPGSLTVHHDSDPGRALVYRDGLVEGMAAGFGIDDGVGVLFEGPRPVRAVSAREGAGACRLSLAGGQLSEDPLDVEMLESAYAGAADGSNEPVDELRELRMRRSRERRDGRRGARG
jgi:dipeptidase E